MLNAAVASPSTTVIIYMLKRRFLSPPPILPYAKQLLCYSPPYSTNASSSSTRFACSPPPLSGAGVEVEAEEVMMGYLVGQKKATQLAHSLWKRIIRKGDVAIDATCGNGHDTLALATLGARVYAMDIQKVALETTSLLLNQSLSPQQREHVDLFLMCHSRMEEVIPSGVSIRLVAFNLGYLPGGEKNLITRSQTTLLALEASKRVLAPGGLISIIVYIGHQGGREELEAVQGFASELPVENWVCCKLQTLNKPLAPVMVLLFRR